MISLERLTDGSMTARNFERLALAVHDSDEDHYKIPLPFAANWANSGGAYEDATYSRHGRLVVLQGRVTKSGGTPAAGNVIATLPTGFRPVEDHDFIVTSGQVGVAFAVGIVSVQADGDVVWQVGTTVETDLTSLSGIVYAIG